MAENSLYLGTLCAIGPKMLQFLRHYGIKISYLNISNLLREKDLWKKKRNTRILFVVTRIASSGFFLLKGMKGVNMKEFEKIMCFSQRF